MQSLYSYERFINDHANGKLRLYVAMVIIRSPLFPIQDIFIFPCTYHFQDVDPVVVGRWFVDTALMKDAQRKKYYIYDMTGLISLHQGFDTSKKIFKGVQEDFEYNKMLLQKRNDAGIVYLTANYWGCHWSVCFKYYSVDGVKERGTELEWIECLAMFRDSNHLHRSMRVDGCFCWLLFGVWCVEGNDEEQEKQETKQGMFDVWLVNNI